MEVAVDTGAEGEAAALMPQSKETRNGRDVEAVAGHPSAVRPPEDGDGTDDELDEVPVLRIEDVTGGGGGAKELEFRFSFSVEGKGVLSGVASSSGVGAGAEAGKRAGGNGAGARAAPWWRRPKVLAAAGAFVVFLAGVATMVALLWPASRGGSRTSTRDSTADLLQGQHIPLPDSPPTTPNPELLLENGQRIISRAQWSDMEPDFRRPLRHPTPYVVIGHTAGTACETEDACFDLLRTYRAEHKEKWGQPDISYNFLIDVKGNVYEGRGWDTTNNYKSWALRCNLAVTLMGNFMNYNVTDAMVSSLQRLLRLGVKLGKLDPNYRLVAQNQVMSTLSPGSYVLKLIASWPHRCLEHCEVGMQCLQADTTEVSPTALSSNETGKS